VQTWAPLSQFDVTLWQSVIISCLIWLQGRNRDQMASCSSFRWWNFWKLSVNKIFKKKLPFLKLEVSGKNL
jgi:hypothetical protein